MLHMLSPHSLIKTTTPLLNALRYFPASYRKIFQPNPSKIRVRRIKIKGRKIARQRHNPLGIEMLWEGIYKQIFKEGNEQRRDCREVINSCLKELRKHGMVSKFEETPEVQIKLPKLMGNDILEHFFNIGEQQAKPYRDLLLELIGEVPCPPKEWIKQPGWTRYDTKNKVVEKVDFPLEDALVFDVEVLMAAGKAPTLATAVSSKAWYGWVSEEVLNGNTKPVTSHHYPLSLLIPIESTGENPRVIVGHNVSYDRARIKEQYLLRKTATRFIDTMSLHVSVSGLTSYQRAMLKSKSKSDPENEEFWHKNSSLNNLVDVYKLYCNKDLKKTTRDIFVVGQMEDVTSNFQQVMNYCSNDVLATHQILQKLLPLFLERFPHPVTLAGMMELGTAYLPINNNWLRYIEESEQSFNDLESEGRILLAKRADQACQLLHNEEFKRDLWMWDEDWTIKRTKMKKTASKEEENITSTQESPDEPDELQEKFSELFATKNLLPKIRTLLPGYPEWYKKLCTKPEEYSDWVPGPHLVSTSMKITPKLLSLTWEGYPLHYIRDKGWGFLVPFTDDLDLNTVLPLKELLLKCPVPTNKPTMRDGNDGIKNLGTLVQDHLGKKDYYSKVKKSPASDIYQGTGIWCKTLIEDCCYFFKLPHKDGDSKNVGNPLAKDFLNKFSENVLAGDTASAEQVLSIARMLSYWRNNRDRINDQMCVWVPRQMLPKTIRESDSSYGVILPQVVVCGTLTRRAMEPTWMTASNAHPERIGSELRAMVQAPNGYSLVGADVDSQELWISSLLGDASHEGKMHGVTPFGWMTLSGTKTDGTDMHSVTAKAVGISRDHAKVLNYARIYGAGQNFAERLLKQFNPSISESEARSKALKMFVLTKGKRLYFLRDEFKETFLDKPYGIWQAYETAKTVGKPLLEVFTKGSWTGGTESAMFNRLEEIANSPLPATPFLASRLSRALEPQADTDDRFLPTRINWVVQSGAVDFLHLMLVSMNWLLGDKIRFCLSFHDEVRYLVEDKYKYQAALAMHITNLLTRSFCAVKVGLNDLPQSVAFFSSVEVDKVLRKEAKLDCKTPSNSHGLEKGYGVAKGESLDIYEAVKKANGVCSSFEDK